MIKHCKILLPIELSKWHGHYTLFTNASENSGTTESITGFLDFDSSLYNVFKSDVDGAASVPETM